MSTASTINTINRELSCGRELFLVFDRDGTLVPFTEDPDDAVLESSVRDSLDRLASKPGVHVGILSARSISQLRLDLPAGKQILAGNYGLEIEVPAAVRFCHLQAYNARRYLERAKNLLEQKLLTQFKFILEDHGLLLCLHFHKTPESLQKQFHIIVSEVAADSPGLYFKLLPTSYEVWPVIDWDKSNGLAKMLQLAQLSPDAVMLLYAGDSIVDESAFALVNQHKGISILVGKRDSEAKFALETPLQLHELICRLAS